MKKSLTIFTTIVLLTIAVLPVYAQQEFQLIGREIWNAPTELTDTSKYEYNSPDKIYVVPIISDNPNLRVDTEEWVKGLYYFSTTKANFYDIPFNYLVGWDGNVFEGISNKSDILAPIEGERAIVVGVLSNFEQLEITSLAEEPMTNLLQQLVDKYYISVSNIFAASWSIKPVDDLQETVITVNPTDESPDIQVIDNYLLSVKDQLKENYTPVSRDYSAEILEVSFAPEQDPGKVYQVEVTVKNTGQTVWYNDDQSEIIVAKKDGKNSDFYITNEWISFSEVEAMNVDNVKPFEETTLKFDVQSPLTYQDVLSEDFILKNKNGQSLADTEFTIEVTISDSNVEFIEVTPTPTDYLNVREQPGLNGAIVTSVAPGEKFIVLERSEGWVKIQVEVTVVGWVSSTYTKTL